MRFIVASALVLFALPAMADERCDVPKANWRPQEELQSELTAKGWSIRNVKVEDGCYEVYGTDKDGNRMEVFFDPATFAAVGTDD